MRVLCAATAVAAVTGLVALPAQDSTAANPPGPEPAETPILEIPGVEKLKITGEYRFRYEDRFNYDFNSSAISDFEIFTQRVRVNFDFQLEDEMRVYVQLQDVRFWGETGTTVARMSPGLDLHQAYLELGETPLIHGEGRIGRQVLSYGAQRILGGLEWAQQGRSFDGVRNSWKSDGGWTTDVFATKVREVVTTRSIRDDAYFGGLYATHQSEDGDQTLDLYALYLYDEETMTAMLTEDRLSLGVRAIQNVGDLELGVEAITQVGERNNRDVPIGETFAAHAHAKLGLGGEAKSFLRGEFNIASGDDPNTKEDERFNNLFPTAHMHLGIMDFALWENVLHGSVLFGINTAKRSKLLVSWHYFRSMEETGRVAGPEGTLTNGGAGNSNELGNEINIVWRHDFPTETVKTHLHLGYGMFIPGQGVEDSMMSDDLAHFVYAQGGVKF